MLRGFDIAAEFADVVARKISAADDPRAKLLRRRRRALRWGLIFAAGCVFWAVTTAVLAAWGWFALVLEITGGVAVVQAMIATLLLIRYRWLQSEPLPAAAARRHRRLPPWGSAARPAMSALGASERGFFSLLGVMERGRMLPADEIRELTAAANQSSAAMAATANEVVSMERAANRHPQSRSYLAPDDQRVHRAARRRSASVQRNGHCGSAIGVVGERRIDVELADVDVSATAHELVGATDRLVGWAQAFDELGHLPRLTSESWLLGGRLVRGP